MNGTGGALVAETLQAFGVSAVFGMEDPIQIMHALDPARCRIVTVHDERHGAMMAHGYSQATGRPGVCAATFGPGATNLITGLLEALRSSVPVIALVQDHPLALKHKNASSDLDPAAALRPFVKDLIRIDAAADGPAAVRSAFRIATSGRPGPVALLCPTDAMAAKATAETHAEAAFARVPALRPRGSRTAIDEAARLLDSAARPVLVAGGGAMMSGAFDEIAALAERFGAPVATTLTGRGAIADSHPLALGPLGSSLGARYGRGQIANAAIAEADLVFFMGSRTGQLVTSDWSLPKPGTAIIHLDIDAAEIGRNFATALGIVGDVRESLRDLLERAETLGERRPAANREAAGEAKAAWRAELAPLAASDRQPMRPERVIAEIARRVDDSTLLCADASYVTNWVISNIDVPRAGRFVLSPRGTGGLGWAFPAAIGAKLADPARRVICVCGDGGFGYAMNELETAARHRVDLLIVVFNNGTLAFQRHWEEAAMGSYRDCDFLDIDYGALARALACAGERVRDPADLAAAIARGLAHPGPYLIDAVVDPEASAPVIGLERPVET